jgi:hypothetical protein
MRRLFLYLILIAGALAPTFIALEAVAGSSASTAPKADMR